MVCGRSRPLDGRQEAEYEKGFRLLLSYLFSLALNFFLILVIQFSECISCIDDFFIIGFRIARSFYLDALAKCYGTIIPARPADDAWMGIARLALAHKSHDMGQYRLK